MKYVDIKPFTVTRQKIELVDKKKYGYFLASTSSYKDGVELIKRPILKNAKKIKQYNLDRKYYMKMFNKQVKTRLRVKEIEKYIKGNSNITKVYRGLHMIPAKNSKPTFVDLYFYNKLFLTGMVNPKEMQLLKEDDESKFPYKRRINEFNKMMLNVISSAEKTFDKKVIIFDLTGISVKLSDFMPRNTNGLFNFYYQFMVNECINMVDTEFLFITKSAFVLINDLTDLSKVNKALIKLSHTSTQLPEIVDDEPDENTVTNKVKQINNTTNTVNTNNDDIEETDDDEAKIELSDRITESLLNQYRPSFGFNGSRNTAETTSDNNEPPKDDDIDVEIEDKISDKVDDVVKNIDIKNKSEFDVKAEVFDKINEDEELKRDIDKLVNNKIVSRNTANMTKRNKLLEKEQYNKRLNSTGKTLSEILQGKKVHEIKNKQIKTNHPNEDMKVNKLSNMQRTYNKNMMEGDLFGIFESLKDKSVPLYILDMKKEDTSNELDKKYTYTIKLEDTNRKRHTVVFDYPKLVDDVFLYLNGNKKTIVNQLMLLPVEKTGPSTVQLCSNYNKMFLRRTGAKLNPYIEKFKKFIAKNASSARNAKLYVEPGNCSKVNTDYKTTITYDDLSSIYMKISMNRGETIISFNQNTLRDYLDTNKIKYVKDDDNLLPIGVKNKAPIYLDADKDIVVGENVDLIEFIIHELRKSFPNIEKEIDAFNVGKKYMYTNVTVMGYKVPLILFLSYMEGLTGVLKKAGIKYSFSDKKVPITKNNNIIQFMDGYLVCQVNSNADNLLLNGLNTIATKSYDMGDLNVKETYLDIFHDLFGSRMLANAFDNFYDNFIDSITLDVLHDLKLPDDLVSLCIYGNTLMGDNQYIPESNMSHYRLRNNEIINGYLYKIIATQYGKFRTSQVSKNSLPFTIPKDALLRELSSSNVVEDYSSLGPILEAEKLRAVSYKGLSGMNQERAFTLEKRTYDKSMKGIISTSTVPSGAVGIVRQLPIDSNVSSARGYLQISDNPDDLNSANMLCPAEALTPGCTQHDDSMRQAMVATQTKHIVPTRGYSRLLVSNGADDILAHIISNDFAFKAKDDGKVVEMNDDTMVIQYKDKTYDVVDIGDRVVKNGGGGFYINNKLTTKLKKGSSFKKDDILAHNNDYFDNDTSDETTYKAGVLSKIAIVSDYFCFEDSTAVSQKLSDKLTTTVILSKDVILGPNSNVSQMVNIGDEVEVGSPLITFDQSYDSEINKLLDKMSSGDDRKEFENLSRYEVKSKHAGRIIDIKVYYANPEDSYSPSLQKCIKKVQKKTKDRKKLIEKYTTASNTNIQLEPTNAVESKYGKIKGKDVGEGVMFIFYVAHDNPLKSADKITFFTALKATVGYVFPKGYEPYSEFREDEEISSLISPISILARMTNSIIESAFVNKVLIEETRRIVDMYFH